MKRQLAHHIHKLLPTALSLFILILIIPLTSQATPYVYTYTGNLFTSTNGGLGYPLEAIGDHVSVQFTYDGDLSALNQTQTFEILPPNIANNVETCTNAGRAPHVWGTGVFNSVPGSNGLPPSWSIYGEPYMLERLAFVRQSGDACIRWPGHSMPDKTHKKAPVTRSQSTKLPSVGRPTKAPLRHFGSHP